MAVTLKAKQKAKDKELYSHEHDVGIKTFLTSTDGVGGKLRIFPEDFIVTERFCYPPRNDNGKYTIAEVTAVNWETNLLIRALAKQLCMSRMRIGFAGTKDKRACRTQLMSFTQVSLEDLIHVKLKNVTLQHMYRSDRPVTLGDLFGNTFSITIRNIHDNTTQEQIEKTASQIHQYGGFPNFFGVQRFGVLRPISHLVGKHIVNDDFEQAVMTYIAHPIKGEDDQTYQVRSLLQKTRNYAEALQKYPDACTYEKAILNKLVVNPNDFVDALTALPKNLLTMFVYAYQSYLFNKMLSERLQRKLPLNTAGIGDIVLPIRNQQTTNETIMVTTRNIEKVNQQIKKQKACVSGLLAGSDSQFSEGEMGDIEHQIIDEESFDLRNFIIPKLPFLSSAGSRRSLLVPIQDFQWRLISDTFTSGSAALHLNFSLPKGCYATCLLREFMKTPNIRDY